MRRQKDIYKFISLQVCNNDICRQDKVIKTSSKRYLCSYEDSKIENLRVTDLTMSPLELS